MKKRIILISITIAILFLVGISYLLFFRTLPNNMIIKSPIFLNNATIPSKYTCDGDNINPPFEIKNIPKGTKSLVLIVDDPDAAGGTWTHWTLWNIDPGTSEIQENSIPSGASAGKTSYGRSKYDGPCPPSGTHHYFLDCMR